jgi:predicted ArsR family transcriptional regulator
VLDALAHGDLQRSQIRRQVFHDNIASDAVQAILKDLLDRDSIELIRQKSDRGRPAELIRLRPESTP